MKKSRKKLLAFLSVLLVIAALAVVAGYYFVLSPLVKVEEEQYIQLYPQTSAEEVTAKVREVAGCDVRGFEMLSRRSSAFKAGNYVVKRGDSMRDIWLRFLSGNQTPVKVVIPAARNLDKVAGVLGNKLMADSAAFAALLGQPEQMALIIPNTYEVYWTISPEDFVERMQKEHDRFWNENRRAKAAAQGLTPDEVATLASIVDEETARNDEKPVVAGLYLNRLHKGILLQADPTVKYAVGDPTLRRILFEHLKVDSPYNTYLHAGLPPTPIRIPSVRALEAVLNPAKHDYLYMCAKEDFSGYHNFAVTLSEHNKNASRYQAALNARGIR
ncbi:MAG: endolytic transglycosylase MltG [Bacteroidaceae bacterium]|nr:endolytic transglycosylase MltG [Bacteroidaceae bacterium]